MQVWNTQTNKPTNPTYKTKHAKKEEMIPCHAYHALVDVVVRVVFSSSSLW
jgi:hypothetical protein